MAISNQKLILCPFFKELTANLLLPTLLQIFFFSKLAYADLEFFLSGCALIFEYQKRKNEKIHNFGISSHFGPRATKPKAPSSKGTFTPKIKIQKIT